MIRTVADVAITEVTIWQQCGYNVPRQEGRENEKYLTLNICIGTVHRLLYGLLLHSFCCHYL
jgi:hypothetical protein